jgi:hypothetical protein
MGKYVQKQLTIQIAQRAFAQNTWGNLPVYAATGLLISGQYNLISGDIKIAGTVTVDTSASQNVIDGTLACDNLVDAPPSGLSYNLPLITPCPSSTMPDLGAVQNYFKTNLSLTAQTNGSTAYADEFVFPGNTTLPSTGTLPAGLYYSNGTITLTGHAIRGNVTFIAKQIVITNSGGASYNDEIYLKPYYRDLLLWANGSQGTLNALGDGDIQINGGTADNTPCVALEGVLYAPNGEIELAGTGAKYWNSGITYIIYRATLDKGAVISKYITISGNYWDIYRW